MDVAAAEASGAKATFNEKPPEPRLSPPEIDRSGPVLRCRERASWLRGYAERNLRAWWPTILAMRWAWGWWCVLLARRSLKNTELRRIASLAEPDPSAARQAKFLARMKKWIADRHKLWMANTLGGKMGEVEWEHVDDAGAVDDAGTYIVPIRTITELQDGASAV
jgi:hypothetical protein